MKSRLVILAFMVVLCVWMLVWAITTNRKYAEQAKARAVKASLHSRISVGPCFMVVSDVHLSESESQYYAWSPKANSGNDLWAAAKVKIDELIKTYKPTFLLVLGDLPKHKIEAPEAHEEINAVLGSLRTLAEKNNIPLIYAAGNNDIPGHHNGDFSATADLPSDDKECEGCWLMASGNAAKDIGADDKNDAGYYSIRPIEGKNFRVIVLNTVPFLNDNQSYEKQFTWLKNQLNHAKAAHEKVLIAMHVPPGTKYDGDPSWENDANDKGVCAEDAFLNIISTYPEGIVGILSSHTHKAGIKVYEDKNGNFLDLGLSIAGVAPGHGNYPSVELINYDSSAMALENFQTFYHRYHQNDAKPDDTIRQWGNEEVSFFNGIVNPNTQGRATLTLNYFVDSLYKHNPAELDAIQQRIYDSLDQKQGVVDKNNTVYVRYGCK